MNEAEYQIEMFGSEEPLDGEVMHEHTFKLEEMRDVYTRENEQGFSPTKPFAEDPCKHCDMVIMQFRKRKKS